MQIIERHAVSHLDRRLNRTVVALLSSFGPVSENGSCSSFEVRVFDDLPRGWRQGRGGLEVRVKVLQRGHLAKMRREFIRPRINPVLSKKMSGLVCSLRKMMGKGHQPFPE